MEITVVTATINRPSLATTVQSVQEQTLAPVRHAILFQQRMKQPIIDIPKPTICPIDIHWIHWQPPNMAEVYNEADKMADTEWIAMLDDDCWWEPEHLENLATLARGTGADFVWSSSYIHNSETGEVMGERDDPVPALGHIDTNEILFKRSCIERWRDFSMEDPGMAQFRGRGIDGRRIERWVKNGATYAHSSKLTCHYGWRDTPEEYHGELGEDGKVRRTG